MRNRIDWPLLIVWIVLLAFCVFVLWATVHYVAPWLADQLNGIIDRWSVLLISWTTGIIQDSPIPRREVYAGYTLYVWE